MLSQDWFRAIDECYQHRQPQARLLTAFLVYQPANPLPEVNYHPRPPACFDWIPKTEAIRQLAVRGYPESFLNALQRWRPVVRILHAEGSVPPACPLLSFREYRNRMPLFRYHLRRWIESTSVAEKDTRLLLTPAKTEHQLWYCPNRHTLDWDLTNPAPECRPLLLRPEERVDNPVILSSSVSIANAPPVEVAEILQL